MYDLGYCTEIWYATMQKINVGFRSQSRRCYNVKTRRCYNVGLWRLKNFHFQPISNVYPTSVSDVVSTSIQRQLFAGMLRYKAEQSSHIMLKVEGLTIKLFWSKDNLSFCDTCTYVLHTYNPHQWVGVAMVETSKHYGIAVLMRQSEMEE